MSSAVDNKTQDTGNTNEHTGFHGAEDDEDAFHDCVSENLEQNGEEFPESNVAAAAVEEYKDLDEAIQFKEEGNRLFMDKQYDLAISQYDMALELCPDSDDCKGHKAAFLHNRGACYFHQEDYLATVDDMTSALDLNPAYAKALRRRAQAYEKLDKLEEALKDVNALLELEPSDAYAIKRKPRLEEECRERAENLKEEAMAKLKELGNGLLGAFGLSLDNFQMQQDPNTGSYSVSFQK